LIYPCRAKGKLTIWVTGFCEKQLEVLEYFLLAVAYSERIQEKQTNNQKTTKFPVCFNSIYGI